MIVKFLGVKETISTGCSACGSKRTSKHYFQREKKYVLPSGRVMKFYTNKEYEVSENDGNFLLNLNTFVEV